MHIQLWRNATIQITIDNTNVLIDPMLGEKGSIGPFPFTHDQRKNPLVPLPFSEEKLRKNWNVLMPFLFRICIRTIGMRQPFG